MQPLEKYGVSHSTSVWTDGDELDEKYSEPLDSISDLGHKSLEATLKYIASVFGGAAGVAAFDGTAAQSASALAPVASSSKSRNLGKAESKQTVADSDEDDDEDGYEAPGYGDDLFGLGASMATGDGIDTETRRALRP